MAMQQRTLFDSLEQVKRRRGRPKGSGKGRTIHHLVCEWKGCGKAFGHVNHKTRFCSVACSNKHQMQQRMAFSTCRHCGVEYHFKKQYRHTYCSRDCAYAHRRENKQARQARLAQERAGRPKAFACRVCLKEFVPTARRRQAFCSDECRMEQARRDAREKYPYVRLPAEVRRCKGCGDEFSTGQGRRRRGSTCSHRCARRIARKQRALVRRMENRTREARINKGDRIDPCQVFTRDDWTCSICDYPCDRHAEVPDPLAPVIDHVTPLARGGEHVWGNVRCAHFICNSHKSDRGADEVRMTCRSVIEALRQKR